MAGCDVSSSGLFLSAYLLHTDPGEALWADGGMMRQLLHSCVCACPAATSRPPRGNRTKTGRVRGRKGGGGGLKWCCAAAAGLWGADVAEFRPERWLDKDYVAGLHPFAYVPFSKGPR